MEDPVLHLNYCCLIIWFLHQSFIKSEHFVQNCELWPCNMKGFAGAASFSPPAVALGEFPVLWRLSHLGWFLSPGRSSRAQGPGPGGMVCREHRSPVLSLFDYNKRFSVNYPLWWDSQWELGTAGREQRQGEPWGRLCWWLTSEPRHTHRFGSEVSGRMLDPVIRGGVGRCCSGVHSFYVRGRPGALLYKVCVVPDCSLNGNCCYFRPSPHLVMLAGIVHGV